MNFLADFTKAANIEAWSRYPKSDGGGQGVRLGFKAGAEWAHDHLAAQEPTDAEVEAAAKAMFDVVSGGLDWNGGHNDETTRERFRNMARAALSAARAARRDEENR